MSTQAQGARLEETLPERVAAALALARIPASKLGPARRAPLAESERELYFWILRRFTTHGRPGKLELREAAERLGTDPDEAFETLAREDLVHRDEAGEITVAYPFSGQPTPHRVRFPPGHEAHAMCAIDALGIAPMFDVRIEIESRDPASGEAISVRVPSHGPSEWAPAGAVVVAGALAGRADACGACCPVVNFFASAANADRWLDTHPDIQGGVISIPEAGAAGRIVFGDVLEVGT